MPYEFEFDSPSRVLWGRFEGPVTDKDLKQYCRDSTARLASTDVRAAITDLSAVTSFQVSRQTILDLAVVRPPSIDRDPIRIIVASSLHVYGMARMFEMEGQSVHPNVHVVHTRQEACEKLGITEPQFETSAK